MRKKNLLIVLLASIFVLVFPIASFAETVNTLEFGDVESKILERNPMVSENLDSYDDAASAKSAGIKALDALITYWDDINTLYTSEPDSGHTGYNAAISYLLQVQKGSLDQQRQSLVSQSTGDILTNIDKGNNTIVWNMEMIYITYNSNLGQLEDYLAKRGLAEKRVQITRLQRDLGMVTDIAVSEAERDLISLESVVKLMQTANKTIIKQFNINLDQDLDTVLVLKDVPKVTAQQITAIDVDKDFEEAADYSYDIMLADNSTDAERKFKNSFYSTYQTVLDKKIALDIEEKKMVIAESKIKTADLKYKLGLLSTIMYQSEMSSFISQQVALKSAENNLFQAWHQYQWAKRGMIFSSGY